MEQNNKSTIFLTVIAIATLLVAVVGATFAFFSAQVTGNDSASSIYIKTAKLGITYNEGNTINDPAIRPGWTSNPAKTFTIENTGDVAMTYHIGWVNVVNTFGDTIDNVVGKPEELTYTMTCDNGVGAVTNVQVPTTTTADIKRDITIAAGATHRCSLTVSFADTSSDQNYNQGRTFSGTINISTDPVSQES